jgi:hypothetical protein
MDLITIGYDETCACSVHRFRRGFDPLAMFTNIWFQIVLGCCMVHIIDYAKLQLYFIRIPLCMMQFLGQGGGREVGYRSSSCRHRRFDELPSIDICLVGHDDSNIQSSVGVWLNISQLCDAITFRSSYRV